MTFVLWNTYVCDLQSGQWTCYLSKLCHQNLGTEMCFHLKVFKLLCVENNLVKLYFYILVNISEKHEEPWNSFTLQWKIDRWPSIGPVLLLYDQTPDTGRSDTPKFHDHTRPKLNWILFILLKSSFFIKKISDRSENSTWKHIYEFQLIFFQHI